MLDFIRKFDAYPKAIDDFKLRTVSGAISKIFLLFQFKLRLFNDFFHLFSYLIPVSIISIFLMAILFFSELSFYLKTVYIFD